MVETNDTTGRDPAQEQATADRRAETRPMNAAAFSRPRRVPLFYVVVGVTVYCTLAWAVAIAGFGAGARFLFPGPPSYAATTIEADD